MNLPRIVSFSSLVCSTVLVAAPLLLAAPLRAQSPAGNPPHPAANPPTPEKVLLGKALFWEEQLSSTNTVACGTCHRTEAGFSDPRTQAGGPSIHFAGRDNLFFTADDVFGSPGVVRNLPSGDYDKDELFDLRPQVTKRKAPSVVDAAYSPLLLTTGDVTSRFISPNGRVVFRRNAALENQALLPILHPVEMGHTDRTWAPVIDKLVHARPLALASNLGAALSGFIGGHTYPQLFKRTFGSSEVSPERIAMAIASYERTLVSGEAPIDRFLAGDASALTPLEQQGWNVFSSPSNNCLVCHPAPLFTDHDFYYLGVRPILDSRGRFYVTLDINDLGKFRTQSLRNVELRAPYFHNGGTATLAEVVEFFDRGGDFSAPTLSPLMHPLNLSAADKAALLAFLQRPLTDPRLAAGQAPFDRPTLGAESNHVPGLFGTPTLGSGGIAPHAIALELPRIGGDHLTVALDGGLAGANAMLLLDTSASTGGVPFQNATSFLGMTSSLITIPVGALQGSGPGAGWASHVLHVPNDPGLIGTSLYGQWFVADPGSGGAYSASEAFRLTLF